MIIVLGAPRTGTTSCARALEQLNLKVLQYCPITNTDTLTDIQSILDTGQSDYDAIVSSHFNETLVRQWIATFPNATFVHCIRNEPDRISSLKTLGFQTDITIANLVKSTAALQQTGRYFELNCDWPGDWKWQALYSALKRTKDELPAVTFPHSNTSASPALHKVS